MIQANLYKKALETAVNLVFFQPEALLGERVYARFGAEFPIRFDFLDTMDGGNLSLQVHPTTEYIRDKFGMFYTQDESYYLLDAGDDAKVYLGLKDGANKTAMLSELRLANEGGPAFNADKYVASWPAKKHDHFLIPAGTIHCSAVNCMVLEISATPYIFTFKLWDWGRMGLDGQPRPINMATLQQQKGTLKELLAGKYRKTLITGVLLALFFVHRAVYETKGRTLEAIERSQV